MKKYIPYNEQESNDQKLMLKFIEKFNDVLTRNNEFGHFATLAWIVNKERTKVLMVHHNIYNSWSWIGAHADGEENLLTEVNEEHMKPIYTKLIEKSYKY